MSNRWLLVVLSVSLSSLLIAACGGRTQRAQLGPEQARSSDSPLEQSCVRKGWQTVLLQAAGLERRVLWKGPRDGWNNGVILVLHGGGGQADHFCVGGKLVQPQIQFAELALARGFAVFALDATTDRVTDAERRVCGKRFDFSVLNRSNIDLPYIEKIISETVPAKRPLGSNPAIFVTGLSTGGYMTARVAAELGDKVTAFAPVSAGDPYGTDTICDTTLSARTSAKGILVDRETGMQIVNDGACASLAVTREARWPPAKGHRPPFKQFHDEADGIVDISCMRKATAMLASNGFPGDPPYVIPGTGRKDPLRHLWQKDYNAPLLDFFASEAVKRI
jgi:poly(3-hydroxybutyrate) depolymerase